MADEFYCPTRVEIAFPGLTADRLARWRWAKTGPRYTKAGRQILYRRNDIEEFLTNRMVGTNDAD